MKKIFLISIILLTLSLIYSCEGFRCATGTIYDLETNQPIDSVKCTVLTGRDVQITNETGEYDVCNNWSHCYSKCPDIEVEFSKIGYKTKTIVNPKKKSIIYLEKE